MNPSRHISNCRPQCQMDEGWTARMCHAMHALSLQLQPSQQCTAHLQCSYHGQAAQQGAQRNAHASPHPSILQADPQPHEQAERLLNWVWSDLRNGHRQARHCNEQPHVLRVGGGERSLGQSAAWWQAFKYSRVRMRPQACQSISDTWPAQAPAGCATPPQTPQSARPCRRRRSCTVKMPICRLLVNSLRHRPSDGS